MQRVTLASDDPAVVSVQLIDDAIIADDAAFTPATTKVMMAGFEYDDTLPDSVNEGDAGAARMSANRNIYVNIRDNAGNERGLNVDASGFIGVTDGGGSLTVDNTVLSVVGGGTEAAAQRVTIASDSTGVLSVDDNGGSLTVDGSVSVSALPASTNTLEVVGDVAQDAAVGGNPVLMGGRASSAAPTDMSADGDSVYLWTTLKGALNIADGGGTISIDDGAGNISIDDGGNSITIDNATLSVTGGGVEASALRVTIASDSTGVLSVDDNGGNLSIDDGGNSITVDNGGTFAVQVDGAALTALQLLDDVVFADDAAFTLTSSKAVAVGAIRDDALAALSAAEGDIVPLRVSSTGALHVTGGGGGTQYNVDDVFTATSAGTVALVVRKDSAASLAGTDGDVTGLQVDANGALRVTGGGGGTEYTVDAAAPAAPTGATFVMERDDALSALSEIEGDWTNPRASANGALWVSVDGTVTVGSHAVTNAGTFATQESGALLTAAQLIDDIVYTDDTSTHSTGTSKGALFMAAATPTDASVDANDIGAVAMTTDRKLHVAVMDALPAGTAAIGKLAANSGVDIGDVDVTSVIAGTGATNLGKAEDAAHSTGDTGVYMLAVRDDAIGAHSGTDGDYESLHTDSQGALWTNLAPNTAGGLSVFMASGSDGSSILVATAQAAKASAGQVYGWYMYNPEAAATFVHFYNTASGSVTVGTTNPLFSIQLPAASASNVAYPHGIPFSTAITVAATTTAGGNTAPATGVSLELFYK